MKTSPSQQTIANASGQTIIETRGIAHTILFLVDHVTNEPRIAHTTAPSPITIGTRITIKWPQSPHGCGSVLDDAEEQFKALAENYVWFNPHLTLSGAWDGGDFVNVEATNRDWTKWRPSDPTNAHWHTEARLQRYLSAHVARDLRLGQDRPVREFIAEFRGLSGTRKQKAILAEIGVSRLSLRSFLIEAANRGEKTIIITRRGDAWALPAGTQNLVVYEGGLTRGASLGLKTPGGRESLRTLRLAQARPTPARNARSRCERRSKGMAPREDPSDRSSRGTPGGPFRPASAKRAFSVHEAYACAASSTATNPSTAAGSAEPTDRSRRQAAIADRDGGPGNGAGTGRSPKRRLVQLPASSLLWQPRLA